MFNFKNIALVLIALLSFSFLLADTSLEIAMMNVALELSAMHAEFVRSIFEPQTAVGQQSLIVAIFALGGMTIIMFGKLRKTVAIDNNKR